MPSPKSTVCVSSTTATTAPESNKHPQKNPQGLEHLTPFNPINAASSFARTTTAGIFREEATDEGGGLRRMRSTNAHPAVYPWLAHVPAPQPTGMEGCVDLEKVNERLMEVVRKARAEKERIEARERIERKAEMRKAMREEKVLEKVVKAVNHVPRGGERGESSYRRGEETRCQNRGNRLSYPQRGQGQGHHPQILQLRTSSSMNILTRSASPLPPAAAAPSHTISPSPWSLLGTAHTRINFPPLSRSLSPTSPQRQANPNPEQRQRGSYDRPDWSESDEHGSSGAGTGAGVRVSTGLRLLVKKSESVLRRGGGGARSKEGAAGGVGMMGGVPERRVVMRMQNDSVVSREVGAQVGGWRCGCLMK